MAKTDLTAKRLRELLNYDPNTGIFRWINPKIKRVPIGSVAGCIDPRYGYRTIGVDGRGYRAHRLAWLYMYEEWPNNDTDHINGMRDDNSIKNLRDVSRAINAQNLQGAHRDSKTLLGVSKNGKNFVARIWTGKKYINLGQHQTPELAHAAYIAAKRELHQGCTI